MSVKIVKTTITNNFFTFNAMALLPSQLPEAPSVKDILAVFTHGYTASKRDCLSWAQRLSEAGIPSVIFDLPGHYLGSFHEVDSFEEFRDHAHECFIDAHKFLLDSLKHMNLNQTFSNLIIGGHSLGAMLSLKALKLDAFKAYNILAIGVGLGIGQHKEVHLFESSFYEKTLNIRRQLVSPALDSDLVFPWIKQEKLDVDLKDKRIHLITGADDVVVGAGGMEALEFSLKSLGNNVTTFEPKKLPHHEPTLAATFIYSFIKKEFNF